MIKSIISKFDKSICISYYDDGYTLFKDGVSGSPFELIDDIEIRAMVRAEAHEIVWPKSKIYVVLTADNATLFNTHNLAFKHVNELKEKVKGVYLVVSTNTKMVTLGATNVYGAQMFDHKCPLMAMEHNSKFYFKVI